MLLPLFMSAALAGCPYLQAPDRYQADVMFLASFEPLGTIRTESSDPTMIAYIDGLGLAHLPYPCEFTQRDFAAREFCKIVGRSKAAAAFIQTRDDEAFTTICGRAPLFACRGRPLANGERPIVVNREKPAGYACIITHEAAHVAKWPATHPRN